MPFGLDLKSVIVGVVLAYFVVPYVMGLISSRKSVSTTQG
jgi:hypothetical protein